MPEIPDIEVFAYNLKERFSGKKLTKVNVVNGKKVKYHRQRRWLDGEAQRAKKGLVNYDS